MTTRPKSRSKTTETSFEVVWALMELDGATIDELSEYLELSPSTVHRHIVTLREHAFVTSEDDVYRVGLQFLTVGGYAQRQVTAFPMIKDKVNELAEQTGERAQFIVEEEGERVYLYTETGQRSIHTGAYVGKRGDLHTSAAGKAILAALPMSRVNEIIEDKGLSEESDQRISDRTALLEELETVRERGYAVNMQETTKGVHAVGAAVTDPGGEPIGALSVSGPASRNREERLHGELPDLILGLVNELELHIEHAI